MGDTMYLNRSTTEMGRTWLIQRLRAPYEGNPLGATGNPFAFGGGLLNGGLSDEAMELLSQVFSFDYMGAAEFEWGSIPAALSVIAKDVKDYEATSFSFPLTQVAKNWRDQSTEEPEGDATIYVISRKNWTSEIQDRIRGWAAEFHNSDLKEATRLAPALRPYKEWDTETHGWLELHHAFFFFTNQEMWEQTATLFGIKTPKVAHAG